MESVVDVVKIVEELIKVPRYALVGRALNYPVYLSTREGVTSLWRIDPKDCSSKRLTTKPVHGAAPPKPNCPYVVFTVDVAGGKELHRIYYVDIRSGKESLVSDTPLMRIFSLAIDGERVAFTAATQEDIAIYVARLGGDWEKAQVINTYALVTDMYGDLIVGFGKLRSDPRTLELFIYDLSTGEFKVYTPKEGANSKRPKIVKDGKILFESDFEGRNKLYIYDLSSDELSKVKFTYEDYVKYGPIEHHSYGETPWGDIWAIGKKCGRGRLFIDGKEIPTPEGMFIGEPVFLGNFVYITMSSLTKPPKVFRVDLRGGEIDVTIEGELPKEISDRLGEVKFVKYKSFDGLEIPTYVVESKLASKPGPTVIYVHGGPWSEVMDSWNVTIASLVASGYHVIAPNFRGSKGYGDWFRNLDIGDPGGGDLMDVIHAREWGVKEGIADPNKVVIMGYSYGGYMTYLIMGKYPNLWCCGVAGAGVVDWVGMYGLGDAVFRKFIDILFAGKKELMKERSPINYVENVRKPLCIIHPQNDTRTPLKPVIKYMERLLELGKVFEAHIAPDMGHIILTTDDALKILLPAILFLKRYVR